jgi:hypothetical protein
MASTEKGRGRRIRQLRAQESEPRERVTAAGTLRVYSGKPAARAGKPLPPCSEIRLLNTSRLLPARYSESVLTRIADNDQDLQQIFALDNATNERLLAEQNLRLGITVRELVFHVPNQRIINAAFTHPHPLGSRFSTPFRGAWYAGVDLPTAKAEVLFHRMVQFAEIAWNEREELEYDQYVADFSGSFHDLRPQAFRPQHEPGDCIQASVDREEPVTFETFRACLDPASYIHSQQLAIELLEAGSVGLLYPSARRSGGTCVVCFRPSVVANVRKRDLYRLTWNPDKAPSFVRAERSPATQAAPAAAEMSR